MTKSEFIKILQKQANTYRHYGNDELAEELDFIIEIAQNLDEPKVRMATLKIPHYNS